MVDIAIRSVAHAYAHTQANAHRAFTLPAKLSASERKKPEPPKQEQVNTNV